MDIEQTSLFILVTLSSLSLYRPIVKYSMRIGVFRPRSWRLWYFSTFLLGLVLAFILKNSSSEVKFTLFITCLLIQLSWLLIQDNAILKKGAIDTRFFVMASFQIIFTLLSGKFLFDAIFPYLES